MTTCQNCGAPNDQHDRFCANCGAPLAAGQHYPPQSSEGSERSNPQQPDQSWGNQSYGPPPSYPEGQGQGQQHYPYGPPPGQQYGQQQPGGPPWVQQSQGEPPPARRRRSKLTVFLLIIVGACLFVCVGGFIFGLTPYGSERVEIWGTQLADFATETSQTQEAE